MAKKPLPTTMDPANSGKQPPFVPEVMKGVVGPPPPKGTYSSTDGLFAKLYDYSYAGANQTSKITQTFRP